MFLVSFLLANVLLAGFLWSPHGYAATGINKQINFQGKVVNTDGTNVSDGSYNFLFCLYTTGSPSTACTTGADNDAVWRESKSISVTDGIFQTNLGDTTSLPGSVDFNTDNIYLGVNFNSDGQMSPLVRFTAAPYALNADKVHGLSVTDTTGTLTIPNGKTISFADAFTTSGAFPLTLTSTASTTATLPSGTITLADLTTSQTLTNKSIGSTGLVFSGATTDITTGTNEDLTVVANGSGFINLNDAVSIAGTATLAGITGSTQCLHVDTSGVVSGTGVDCGAGGSTDLQTAYSNDADSSNTTISLTSADDSLIFTNPTSSGTDSAFLLQLSQQNTTAGVVALDISQASNNANGVSITANAIDGETGLALTANALTSGYGLTIASSSVALTGSLENITLSGSNAANTGSLLAIDNTGTANANTSLYIKHYATGTNNLAFRVDDVSGDTTPFIIDGNGNVGIGNDTSPVALLTVGAADVFQVNSSGAIAAATGITSSGTITFSGLSTAGIVTNTSGGVLGTVTSIPIANGGTNAITIGSAGSIAYSTGSAYAFSAVGTSGQALISGGTGAPTFFAPTAGSILFAGTGGILQQDNASFFFDDTNNRLGLGTTSPLATLNILGSTNALRLSYDVSNYASLSTASDGTLSLTSSNATESQFVIGTGSAVDDSVAFDGASQDYFAGLDDTTGNFMIGSGFTVQAASAYLNITSGGLIGINMTPTARLDVTHASTSTTGATEYSIRNTFSDTGIVTTGTDTTYGSYNSVTRTGATGGTIDTYGQYTTVTADNAGAGTSSAYGNYVLMSGGADSIAGYGVNVTASSSGNSYGYLGTVLDSSTGANSNAILSLNLSDTGVVTTGTDTTYGADLFVVRTGATGGTIDTYGLNMLVRSDNAGAGTSTAYGAFIDTYVAGSSNADTVYGLRIATEANAGTTAYGVYVDVGAQAGTEYAAAFMNGSVGIGDTTPDNPLDITSTSQQLRLSYTDGSVDGVIYVDSNEYLTLAAGTTSEINRVQIGVGGAGNTTPDFFGLDVKSNTGDPAGGFEGAMYYNTSDNVFRCYQNTGWTNCIGGGGAQTPWTSDISAAGYDLGSLSNLGFQETTGAPTGTDVGLYRDNSGDLTGNVLTGKTFNLAVDGTDEYNFSSTALAMNGNNITGLGTALTASGALTLSSAATSALTIDSGTTGTINIGTDANAETINIGNIGAAVKTIAIGNNSQANTITIGDTSVTGLSLADNNWSIDADGVTIISPDSAGTVLTIHNTLADIQTALMLVTEAGAQGGGRLGLNGYNLDTEDNGDVGVLDIGTYVTKNDSNTRAFHVSRIRPTLDTGGSNTNTTINVLTLDTVNTATTGLTTNLLYAAYGGSQRFVVDSNGAATLTGAIAANGGITFDAATDTVGAFTAAGTIDMSTQILTNIGNTGTDFVASTGALTLAGVLTANGGITLAASQIFTASSLAYMDLGAITHGTTAVQGLRLPQAASASPSSPSSGEGYLAWDSAGNQLIYYTGAAWATITGGGSDLQTSYGLDADGSNATISLTAADDGLIFTNPSSGGNNLSAFVLQVTQQHTTDAIAILDLVQSSNAANGVNLTANSIDGETGLAITTNGLTSGSALSVASSSTAFTGSLAGITLSGSNAANTGNVFAVSNTGTANTNVSLFVDHRATGTNNLAVRVDDVSGDTTPFVIDGTGKVGIGTAAPARALDIVEAASSPQLRLSKDLTNYSEMTVDSVGDLEMHATGNDIRALTDNLWVCDGGACPALTLSGQGNIFVENVLKFGNGVYMKNDTSTELGVYDANDQAMLIFDQL